jgi:hypothetical protein
MLSGDIITNICTLFPGDSTLSTKPNYFSRSVHWIVELGVVCFVLAGCGGGSKSVPQINWTNPSPISYGTPLSTTQLDATTSVPGSFDYSPSLGTVLSAGSQTLSVTFTPTDTSDYATVTVSVTLPVEPLATPAITWSAPAAIPYGTPLNATQLNATESVPGTFVYNPALGAVIPAGSQTLFVTFTPTDTNYTIVTGSVSITVNQATPTLSWATPAAIPYGTLLGSAQLNAASTVAGRYAYSPAAGSVLPAGSQTLFVTFTPFDTIDYTSASTSVSLTVNQAIPHLTWSPRAWLAVGSPLGSGQLNATALAADGSTPLGGSFVYSPPAGTIFNTAGPQNLSVTFTPSDTADFTSAQSSIAMTASVFGVAAWGDSLTCGCSGESPDPYPSELQKLITLPVVNLGVSGNTSTQIGVREGGVPTTVAVEGGIIPATGGVTVTFPFCPDDSCADYIPVAPQGPAGGVSGTILGVHGTVTIDSTGTVLTFTRTNSGSAVYAYGNPSFVVDTPYANYLPVFWEGRNDFGSAWTNQILSDLAAQVATVPHGQDYLVLSVINENRPEEWYGVSGNDLYQWLIPFNEQLESIYGSHYLDVRKLLVDAYDPTQATDVTDYQHDEVPSSLRAIDNMATLAFSIGPNDTAITLTQPNFPPGSNSILKIDNGAIAENVLVTAVSGNRLTVTRGFGGNQTSHAAGAHIIQDDIVHLNAQGYQVVANAVADYLSAYAQ